MRKIHLFFLAWLCLAFVPAFAAESVGQDMIRLDRDFVPVYYYLKREQKDELSTYLKKFDKTWTDFQKKWGNYKKKDKEWEEHFRQIKTHLKEGKQSLEKEKWDKARDDFSFTRRALVELRESCDIAYLPDRLMDVETSLDNLKKFSDKTNYSDSELETIKITSSELSDFWVVAWETEIFEELYGLDDTQTEELSGLVEAFNRQVESLREAIQAQDKKKIGEVIREMFPAFDRLLRFFGNF